jgi:hypothetical protein
MAPVAITSIRNASATGTLERRTRQATAGARPGGTSTSSATPSVRMSWS